MPVEVHPGPLETLGCIAVPAAQQAGVVHADVAADHAAAGGPLGPQVVAHAALSGLVSGAMALTGLALGGAASRMASTPAQRWAAVGLLAASCVVFLV